MKIALPDRLDDGVVALRPLRVEDARPYAQAFRDDPSLGRLVGLESDPDEQSARERIARDAGAGADEDRRSVRLAIVDPADAAFFGVVTLHSLEDQHRRGEVGFWVVHTARRRGLGSRAVRLMVGWAFRELDLLRVEMTTTRENPAIPALAARLGFTHEGTLRSRNIERGRPVDILWFGVLREEWQSG